MDRKLKQFLAVAETGNVSLAAETLNVSQPTVSVNLRRLEDHYGVPLLSRSSRGVVLTEFGKILYEHARGMDRLNRHAASEIRDLKQTRKPRLRLACGYVWWERFLRETVAEIRTRHPESAIHIDICSSLEGLRGLLSGDIALFVGTRVRRISDGISMSFEKLFDTGDLVFARADHPLAGCTCVLDDLSAYPRLDVAPFANSHFGIAEQDHDSLRSIWDGFRTAQLSTNSMTAGIGLLQDSDAWIYYTREAALQLGQHGIHPLDVSDAPTVATEIGIYRSPDKTLTPIQAEAVALIRQNAARLDRA